MAGPTSNANIIDYNNITWSHFPSIPTIAPGYAKRICVGRSINGASAATTALTFEGVCTLANSIPTFIVLFIKTGTPLASVVQVRDDAPHNLIGLTGLVGIGSTTDRIIIPITIASLVRTSGNLNVVVTTPNVASLTFDVEVYGYDNT